VALGSDKGKTILIAHNAHLATHKPDDENPVTSMGEFLSESLGDAYAPVGLTARQVEVNWAPVSGNPPPAVDGSWEAILESYRPSSFLDFSRQSTTAPLIVPGQTYAYGLPTDPPSVPSAEFRGVIFLDHSGPMTYAVAPIPPEH
jgi:erythromycin esterase-like protein